MYFTVSAFCLWVNRKFTLYNTDFLTLNCSGRSFKSRKKIQGFSRSETFTSRTSGTRPCSPESTPWPPCCALWSPAPRTWPAVPPSASPCSGWTGWGWRQAWSSDSTSQSSDPAVGERRSYFKPQHVFTVRFHSSSCSSTLTCFQP